jgi:TRAP-type C4-dicarboxylate transport system permease small subunit
VKILQWIDRLLVVTAVAALTLLMLQICVSVTARYIFNSPVPDDLVISEFLMVFIVFLPLSSVQAEREHVFVTIFTEWMSNNTKVILETFGVFIGLIAFAVLSAATFADFKHAWDYGSYVTGLWELVEWPPKFAVFFGIAILTLRLAVDAVQSVRGIVKGTATATRSEEDRVLDAEF